MKNQLLLTLATSCILLACNKGATQDSAPAVTPVAATATVTVDCGVNLGTIQNSLFSRANITFTGGTLNGTPLKTTDNNYLIGNGIAKEATRLFISTSTVKDNGINNYDAYVTDAARVSKELLVVLSSSTTGNGLDTAGYRSLVRQILTHYKALAPNMVYIEAVNEYDLFTSPKVDDATYYNTFYRVIYQEVNRQNALLRAGVKPLQVGGPCVSKWQADKVQNFISNYAADTGPHKKLDFISYHEYCSWNTPTGTKTDQLIQLGTRRSTIEGFLSASGLNTNIPVFVTEHGIFPGDKLREAGSPYTVADGLLMAAASAATYNYYYVTSGNNKMLPFLWDTRFDTNPEKSIFAASADYGINVPTPFGNTIMALKLMDSVRVKSTSTPIDVNSGLGVYGMATTSAGKVNVLIWNWQHRNTTAHIIDINIVNLPAGFNGKTITMTRRLIDSKTSNFLSDKTKAELQVVETILNFNPAKYTVTLPCNAVTLLTLTAN